MPTVVPLSEKSKRRKLDQYMTEPRAIECLLKRYPYINGNILEPCSGKGAMAGVLSEIGKKVFTNDLDKKMPSQTHIDAAKCDIYLTENGLSKWDWVLSNPPYSCAFPILTQAYRHCKVGCAFLFRLSFLEPTYERGSWLNDHPPTTCIVMPRISFTEDKKTDSVTVAWLIWDKSAVRNLPAIQFVTREEFNGI